MLSKRISPVTGYEFVPLQERSSASGPRPAFSECPGCGGGPAPSGQEDDKLTRIFRTPQELGEIARPSAPPWRGRIYSAGYPHPASPGPRGFKFRCRVQGRARRQVSSHLGRWEKELGAVLGRRPHPRRGGARTAGPMGRGARRLGAAPPAPLPPLAAPAPPHPGLKPRGQQVAALGDARGRRVAGTMRPPPTLALAALCLLALPAVAAAAAYFGSVPAASRPAPSRHGRASSPHPCPLSLTPGRPRTQSLSLTGPRPPRGWNSFAELVSGFPGSDSNHPF